MEPLKLENVNPYVLYVGLLVVACFALNHAWLQPTWSPIVWPKLVEQPLNQQIYYHEQLVPNGHQLSTHSVSSVVLPSNDVMAFWFAGTREGHKDVRIFQSVFHQQGERWEDPKPILDVPSMDVALGRYIGKLGNPLAFVDSQQRMWLFFVTVSYGGWAGSSLNVMWSEDLGHSWNQPKRLVTSPFINISTLVRNHMFELEDGSLLLPIYHEFIGQFPETLRVSRQGEVISKARMYGHGGGIQPVLLEGKGGDIHAMMRSGSHTKDWRVLSLKGKQGGQMWEDLALTPLPNPNSAFTAMRMDDKHWLWIGNHDQQHRHNLTLAITDDLNGHWPPLFQFEYGETEDRFSYPSLTQDQQGTWHLMYTYKRKHIKHIRFNQAWLQQVMKQQQAAL